ncbi:HAMP domain-containing histidine kinase [Chitinophaga agrisoli]|uniref:histidine kinase n=1 Tax=Chitinophaga agrisoli TaxID=2607653 RepID=A0A5B2VTT8_9BACT|nr:HAMP domain-containing sensor histidine kinase [Chitinophaga agrisoli]KAA2241732.1 HAMP domain-containing histidine kinase [Chitinophaga agrisoli]
MESFIRHVVNIGIRPEHPFEEQKKIRLLNVGCLIATVILVVLFLLNTFTGHYLLAASYVVVLLTLAGIYLLHHYQRFSAARYITIFITAAFGSFLSLGYHNNTELLLLLNIAIMVLLLDAWWLTVALTLVDMFLFIFIRIHNLHFPPLLEQLPLSRDMISATSVFVLMAIALLYSKYEQGRYRQQMEALNRQNEEKAQRLENLNKAKEKILSILSHDLRQPLAAMKSLLQVDEGLSPVLFNEFAGRVHNSLDHLLLSLDNTLRWSYTQLKGVTAYPQYYSPGGLLQQLRQQLDMQLQDKALQFNIVANGDTLVYADPDHLTIILRNLLSNAVKFTPRDGRITATVTPVNGVVEISIADTGVGMDTAMQARLFDLEHHFTRYGTENEHGTGLGLLVVKELVELNGGTIRLSSEPAHGTVFYIHLPASFV